MPDIYVVLDEEGYTSLDDELESAEGFEVFEEAQARAEKLAIINAGSVFGVYVRVADVVCQVGLPETTMLLTEKADA